MDTLPTPILTADEFSFNINEKLFSTFGGNYGDPLICDKMVMEPIYCVFEGDSSVSTPDFSFRAPFLIYSSSILRL